MLNDSEKQSPSYLQVSSTVVSFISETGNSLGMLKLYEDLMPARFYFSFPIKDVSFLYQSYSFLQWRNPRWFFFFYWSHVILLCPPRKSDWILERKREKKIACKKNSFGFCNFSAGSLRLTLKLLLREARSIPNGGATAFSTVVISISTNYFIWSVMLKFLLLVLRSEWKWDKIEDKKKMSL